MMDVFWVEDMPEIVELMELALELDGAVHRLEVAGDVQQATAALRRRLAAGTAPDLVVLDLRLPDGDGLEVWAELDLQLLEAEVPVVVLTSSPSDDDVDRTRRAGLDHLVKPLHFGGWQELVATLGTYARAA